MSTPPPAGTLFDCWMGGLPTTTLSRMVLLVAAGKTTIPLVLPIAVLDSTRLLSPERTPMPKSVAVPVA